MADSATPTPVSSPRKKKFKWGFLNGGLVLILLYLYVGVPWKLFFTLWEAEQGSKIMPAIGLFFSLLPISLLLVWKPANFIGFFKSIKVGIINLVFIGVGAVIGGLFQQEDKFNPMPTGAVASLNQLVESGDERAWTRNEQIAYDRYSGEFSGGASFRNAQAFFIYRFAESLGLDGMFGLDESLAIDYDGIQAKLDRVEIKLPAVEARFGEDYSIAIQKQSRTGLITRARNKRIIAVEEMFDDFWWSTFVWADRFDWIRVYHSPWYALTWLVLFLGVFSNTFRGGLRRQLKPGRWGFLATHAGVMLVCLGGLLSRVYEERGIMNTNIGKVKTEWQSYNQDWLGFHGDATTDGEPPFKVRLDAFRADPHDVLSINYLATNPRTGARDYEFPLDSQPEERVWDGRVLKYDYQRDDNGELGNPQFTVRVKKVIRQSSYDPTLQPAKDGEMSIPKARLALVTAAGKHLHELPPLVPGSYGVLTHALSGSRVRLTEVENFDAAKAALAEKPVHRLGNLVRAAADADTREHDIATGLVFQDQTEHGNYTVEVLQVLPSLTLLEAKDGEFTVAEMDRDIAYIEPNNAAVELKITNEAGESERRWVLEQDVSQSLPIEFVDLRYQFYWDRWASGAKQRYLLMMSPNGEMWWGMVGQPKSIRAVKPGEQLALGEPVIFDDSIPVEEQLTVVQALPKASLFPAYTQVANADFFDTSPAAARIEFSYPDGKGGMTSDEVWMRTKDGYYRHDIAYTSYDGEPREVVVLLGEQRGGMPIKWESKLTILEEDEQGQWAETQQGLVRVNDYLEYKGYRFFQTNHDPRDPTYSGIGVVYDPGIEWVLTGFYLVMFGTMVVFLIKPIFTKRHRAL